MEIFMEQLGAGDEEMIRNYIEKQGKEVDNFTIEEQ